MGLPEAVASGPIRLLRTMAYRMFSHQGKVGESGQVMDKAWGGQATPFTVLPLSAWLGGPQPPTTPTIPRQGSQGWGQKKLCP